MESSTQLPSTSTAKNFEYKYWYWKMYSSTSTVKKFEYEYFYKFRKKIFYEVTWRTERARLNKQRFQWRHSFSEIFILVITVIGLG